MVTESPVKMPSTLTSGSYDELEVDIDALLREHQQQRSSSTIDRSREFAVHRSGSAPPTVEGSMLAMRSVLGTGDDEIRSHPAYLAYYYSNENTNPRLPPPGVSREDWRATQRFRSGAPSFGGIGDQRKKVMNAGDGGSMSLFSGQPVGEMREGEEALGRRQPIASRRESGDWGNEGLTGLSIGLGARKKSFLDVLQEDLSMPNAPFGHPSIPVSRGGFDGGLDLVGSLDSQLIQQQSFLESASVHSGISSPSLNRVHSIGSVSQSLTPGWTPLLRSRTPDPKSIQRLPSPGLPPISERVNLSSDLPSHMLDDSDIASALSAIDLSTARYVSGQRVEGPIRKELAGQSELLLSLPNDPSLYTPQDIGKPEIEMLNIPSISMVAYNDQLKKNGLLDQRASKISANGQTKLPRLSSNGMGTKMPPLGSSNLEGSSSPYNKTDLGNTSFAGSNLMGFSSNQIPQERLYNHLASGANLGIALEAQYLNRAASQSSSGLQAPSYSQYLQRTSLASQAASLLNDSSPTRNFSEASLLDMTGYHKAYLEALLAQQKLQYGLPILGNSVGLESGPHSSSSYGLGMPYTPNHVSSSILSSPGTGNPLRQSDRLSRFPLVGRNTTAGNLGSWPSENGIKETGFTSSFLEEFKNNKTKSFELSDIVNHVVEFSADQYGSRFIQQKLETASVEEKNTIFPEILPHARALMTDVFGNYVIQKFFEHGTEGQRMQLASQLKGHVLTLSLQMYGCRVIQKALEVVDVDRQTQMVSELDGSIMKCVRDQNGNHVIQKCIERVPQDKIQFIISTFYGQVVTLSTHPYGCRVIQRVLEHCDDAKTQSIMMEEILKSVSTLAQDQYGNYVVQHVLQHGKPDERSAIISTLAGQIVKMSQQKFASNVVEKCLTYGSADERQLLINEMIGCTDENEPLQAMMKDQFGNYVVQKVLETCDDQNRELILSRVKVHLNALKRYTYGKHIVTRVEKLVAAGERHVGMSTSCS